MCQACGLFNGAFGIGYFDGWQFDTSLGGGAIVSTLDTQAVPEPATVGLLGAGISALAARRLRRRTTSPNLGARSHGGRAATFVRTRSGDTRP